MVQLSSIEKRMTPLLRVKKGFLKIYKVVRVGERLVAK